MSDFAYTPEEDEIQDLICKVWNKFQELPVQHYRDKHEFLDHIHVLQQIIMVRPVMRMEGTANRVVVPDWDIVE